MRSFSNASIRTSPTSTSTILKVTLTDNKQRYTPGAAKFSRHTAKVYNYHNAPDRHQEQQMQQTHSKSLQLPQSTQCLILLTSTVLKVTLTYARPVFKVTLTDNNSNRVSKGTSISSDRQTANYIRRTRNTAPMILK